MRSKPTARYNSMMTTAPATRSQAHWMSDLAPAPTAHAVVAITHDAQMLTLRWDDGRISRFAAIWLRDNCPCPACRHPQAMERLHMFIDHETPCISQVTQTAADLVEVRFNQGTAQHAALFDVHWLRQHCYSSAAREEVRPSRRLWDAGLNDALPTVQAPPTSRREARENDQAERRAIPAPQGQREAPRQMPAPPTVRPVQPVQPAQPVMPLIL